MKKVTTETTALLSIILFGVISFFAVAQLIFCMIAGNMVLEWLKNAHIGFYVNSTAVSAGITKLVIDKSFQSMFSAAYIRVMSMYIFVLCLPVAYALFNIYLISKNGQGNKPFRSSTGACLRSITLAFTVEFLFATVLFVLLKLIMKVLPFYFMYAMVTVAVFSLIAIVFSLTVSALINRMGDLRNEHARQIKNKAHREAPVAEHSPITLDDEETDFQPEGLHNKAESGERPIAPPRASYSPESEKKTIGRGSFTSEFDDILNEHKDK